MRAVWNGHIAFGLVSIPVSLHSAIEAGERVAFRLLHRKDRAPIVYKKFCSKEDVEVPNDEIVRGMEVDDDEFALVEKEDLEGAKKEAEAGSSGDALELLQFVDLGEINPVSFDHPYFLAPRKGGETAYAVLREALLEVRRAGIGRLVLRGRPTLAALLPQRSAIALETLRPFEEMRDPSKLAGSTAARRSGEIKMARLLIDQLSADGWDPAAHPNAYRKALEKLLASKRRFHLKEGAERPAGARSNVVDLMDALKKSLGQSNSKARSKPRSRRAGAA